MFTKLKEINIWPAPFQYYTAAELWTDELTAKQMPACHLNECVDASSRNKKFIKRSVEWIVSHFNKITLDKCTIIEESRNRVVYNWLRYFSKESLAEELSKNAFTVARIFANVAGGPYDSDSAELAIIAQKKEQA